MKKLLLSTAIMTIASVANAFAPSITSSYVLYGQFSDAEIQDTIKSLNNGFLLAPLCNYDQTVVAVHVQETKVKIRVSCKGQRDND